MIRVALRPAMLPAMAAALAGAAAGPVITGTPYPGETLTSSMARQWFLNGVAISGQTGSTYVVRLNDIGRAITQTGSNTVTIWHPRDLPGVTGVYLANFGLLNASATAATAGQAVATWQDQSGLGNHLTQATASLRPLARIAEVAGNNTVLFDGSDDTLEFPAGSLGTYQNKSIGYLLAALSDTTPAGGNTTHSVCSYRVGGAGSGVRIGLFTMLGSVQAFASGSRRLDADGLASVASGSNTGYRVLTNESLWGTNALRLRVNGSQAGSGTFASGGGPTSNTASISAFMGGSGSAGQYLPGHVAGLVAAAPGVLWTAKQMSQMERYLGLLIGQNIPLQ